MSEVLLTGGSGFLGKALIRILTKRGYNITSISKEKLDLSQPGAYLELPRKKFSTILHLATWTRAGTFCREFPGDQWLVNEQINLNLLQYWKQYSLSANFIAFGTSAVYDKISSSLREADYLRSDPPLDYYGYSTTKMSMLHGLLSIQKQYNAAFQYFIPSMIYGPNYHVDGRPLHFVYDIIRKVYRNKINGDEIILWGDGTEKREMIYIDDVVEILSRFIRAPKSGVYNLNSGQSFSINEIVIEICSILEVDYSKISYDPKQGIGKKDKLLNNERLMNDCKFEFTSLNEGLRKTVNWVVKNYEII